MNLIAIENNIDQQTALLVRESHGNYYNSSKKIVEEN